MPALPSGLAIDATRDVLAVHQKHDYSHLPGNKPPYGSEVAKSNLAKAGGRKCVFNILDTNRELVGGRIRRPELRLVRILRRLERLFINDTGKGWSWEISLRLQQMQRPLAVKPRRKYMRVGHNPARFIENVAQPAEITVAVVNCIPFLSGYYEQSLEVLKVVVESLDATAGNGSSI